MKRMRSKLTGAVVGLLLFVAAVTTAGAQTLDELAARGAAVAQADPLAVELRNRQPDDASRRGFDIGMAAAEGQTLPGPGKDRLRDSLPLEERGGFNTAVTFSLDRNRNAGLAATGAAIAKADPLVAKARTADPAVLYWLGFDIATGIFGDPALGAKGNTATGPGSLGIRDALNSDAGKRGFNAAVTFHLGRLAFVTNDKDSGEGSLRQAINQANARPGTTILFPRDKVVIIQPARPLPPITAHGTVLNGPSGTILNKRDLPFGSPALPTSYTGPLAWILGEEAGTGADGLVVQANNCTVRGLVISDFDHNQIAINGSGTRVKGCYLGTTPGGSGGSGGYGPFGRFGVAVGLRGPGGLPKGPVAGAGTMGQTKTRKGPLSSGVGANKDKVNGTLRTINHGATVYVGGGARNTVLGGADAGAGNFIWNDALTNASETGGTGVQVAGNAANGTTIRGNVFHSTGPGIVLQTDTQRRPEIQQVLPGVAATVQGVLNSVPNTSFAVELFSNGSPVATTSVTTDDGGSASFEVVSNIPNRPDQFIAATATNLETGDTSAFSAARPVGGATISGQVISENAGRWPNVEVTLRQDAAVLTTTASDYAGGYYQFCHLPLGTYTVTASRRDLLLLPESRTVTLEATDATNVDFRGSQK